MSDICFIVMPFGSIHRPSLGVSLLKSELENISISSRIHYFNLIFAKQIGIANYNKIAEEEGGLSLLGELIFSDYVFGLSGCNKQNIDKLTWSLKDRYSMVPDEGLLESLLSAKRLINRFLNICTQEVLKEKPKLIGFTSMFHQNCASLALAKSIKLESNIPIIFGGANCEGEMGSALLRNIDFIAFITIKFDTGYHFKEFC